MTLICCLSVRVTSKYTEKLCKRLKLINKVDLQGGKKKISIERDDEKSLEQVKKDVVLAGCSKLRKNRSTKERNIYADIRKKKFM